MTPDLIPLWQDAVRWYEGGGPQNLIHGNFIETYRTCHGAGTGTGARTNVGYVDGHALPNNVLAWKRDVLANHTKWRKP